MLFFSFKNVFIILCLCWGMFVEKVGPIFWKKELKLFCNILFFVNFVSIDYRYKVWWEIFFVVTLIEQFIYGGPSLFYIWYIFVVKFWWIVIFLAVFIFLWRMQLKLFRFFSSVSYIGESESVNLRRLYILSLNLIEFIIPIVIHGFFLCL